MKVSQWLGLLLMFVFSDACVDPLSVPVVKARRNLVVDGMITDTPGPYRIKLFMSAYQNEDETKPLYVSGALVKIIDDLANEEILLEDKPGEYVTGGAMQGVVGRKYQLDIRTPDEKHYQSSFEEIFPSGSIDNVYFEFHENDINENDLSKPQDALWIYIDASGVVDKKNLIRWRWQGTFHTHTYPEERTIRIGDVWVPDPFSCSGFIVDDDGGLVQITQCVCCDCWNPVYNSNVILSPGEISSEEKFNHVLLGKIPVDKAYFDDKFHINVEQLALTETVYDFWNLVAATKEGAENIFQPNVVKVKGNVHCLSDESEEVYGIFSAASKVEKAIFINRADIPKRIPEIGRLISDCRVLYPGATNQRPPFW
jgi:hypothetical protein